MDYVAIFLEVIQHPAATKWLYGIGGFMGGIIMGWLGFKAVFGFLGMIVIGMKMMKGSK